MTTSELSGEQAPQPPVNVRLVLEDDTEVPVECTYTGWDGELHIWTLLVPQRHQAGLRGVRMDALPAKTQVAVKLT